MHIKTLRHKSDSIERLLVYMVDGMDNVNKDLMIAHNLPNMRLSEMAEEFRQNDQYRRRPAKVRWYHEVLSFSPLDRENLSDEKLETIAQEYIKKRNPRSLCFAVSHKEAGHIHIHFCFSGTEFRNKKTLRMDNKTFEDLRTGMEQYQQQMFPELSNSIVYTNREKKLSRGSEREYQMRKRLGKTQIEKEQPREVLQTAYNKAKSRKEFLSLVENSGLSLSMRSGKVNGIKAKRKYRFSTLGITSEMLMQLDRFAKRYKQMEMMRSGRDDDELELEM